MYNRLSLSRESFRELARQGNLIPIYREIIADMETPVSAFQKIDTGDHSFLFESVEKGGKFARYSFLGASPQLIFKAHGKNDHPARGRRGAHLHHRGRPAARARAAHGRITGPCPSRACRSSTAARSATSAFEAVTQFEPTVPRAKKDDLNVPDAYFFVTDTLLIFDHLERRIKIVANAHVVRSRRRPTALTTRRSRGSRRSRPASCAPCPAACCPSSPKSSRSSRRST